MPRARAGPGASGSSSRGHRCPGAARSARPASPARPRARPRRVAGRQRRNGVRHNEAVHHPAGDVGPGRFRDGIKRNQDHPGYPAQASVADGDEQPARHGLRGPQRPDAPGQGHQRVLYRVLGILTAGAAPGGEPLRGGKHRAQQAVDGGRLAPLCPREPRIQAAGIGGHGAGLLVHHGVPPVSAPT